MYHGVLPIILDGVLLCQMSSELFWSVDESRSVLPITSDGVLLWQKVMIAFRDGQDERVWMVNFWSDDEPFSVLAITTDWVVSWQVSPHL